MIPESESAPIYYPGCSSCLCRAIQAPRASERAWESDWPSSFVLSSFTAAPYRRRATAPGRAARSPCVYRVFLNPPRDTTLIANGKTHRRSSAVLGELEITAEPVHPDGDAADAAPGVEVAMKGVECRMTRHGAQADEGKGCREEPAASTVRGIRVNSSADNRPGSAAAGASGRRHVGSSPSG